MNNAEKIHSMSDLELAVFLNELEDSKPKGFEEFYELVLGSRGGTGIEIYDGFASWFEWLKRETL
jgi:hypothetical protein